MNPLSPVSQSDVVKLARLTQWIHGFELSQAIYVAAKLGIADLLKGGRMPVSTLADRTRTCPSALCRLLRVLSGYGIFEEVEPECFDVTPLGAFLQEDAPHSVKGTAVIRGEEYYRTWGELISSVRTGEPSFERVHGMTNWAYRHANPDSSSKFNLATSELARLRAVAVLNSRFLPQTGLVIDLGGGDGTLLRSVLEQCSQLRGILFDLPDVIKTANIGDRCSLVAGDFLREIPRGGNVYMLSAVLHDWNDETAMAILRRCAGVIDSGKLLIVERIMPEPNEYSTLLLSDLDMLVNTGGCERDGRAWRQLLNSSGFTIERIAPPAAGFHVIQAAAGSAKY